MTSIAVTASICASASEAALLVASFMPFSLAHDPPKCGRCGDKIMRLFIDRATARPTSQDRGKSRARIDCGDTTKPSDRTRETLGKNRTANIFGMMAPPPSYFEQYCRLGGAIRHKGELDPVVRELAITRTGILCEAAYEIVAHKRIGKNVGVTDGQNATLQDCKSATSFRHLHHPPPPFPA